MRAVGVTAKAATTKTIAINLIGDESIAISILEPRRVNGTTVSKADQMRLLKKKASTESKDMLTEVGMRTPYPSEYRAL